MEVKHESGLFYLGDDKDNNYARLCYTFYRDDVIIIDSTEVDEDHRGQNLGKKVLVAAIEWARKEGIRSYPNVLMLQGYARDTRLWRYGFPLRYGQDNGLDSTPGIMAIFFSAS